jgi:hypothetical protein
MFTSPPASDQAMLLCHDCGVLHPLPGAQPSAGPADAEDRDDLESFRSEHRDHHLERAFRLPDPILHDRPAWDPMARTWFRVAVGEHSMFVCSSRTSIDEPRHHVLCTAPPAFSLRAEVDQGMLRRALERHFFPNRLSVERLNAFVAAARKLYAAVEAACVETSFDDTEHANAEIGPCPLDVQQQLRIAAEAIFEDAWERDQIHDFIAANTDEYGALAIRILRELSLTS